MKGLGGFMKLFEFCPCVEFCWFVEAAPQEEWVYWPYMLLGGS